VHCGVNAKPGQPRYARRAGWTASLSRSSGSTGGPTSRIRGPCGGWRPSQEFARVGWMPPTLEEWALEGSAISMRPLHTVHPIGTTRMSRDLRHGVVDPDCQVHGVDSLYVAGSSTFATGGHAIPRQMIRSRHPPRRYAEGSVGRSDDAWVLPTVAAAARRAMAVAAEGSRPPGLVTGRPCAPRPP
jgi:hypothetical protein